MAAKLCHGHPLVVKSDIASDVTAGQIIQVGEQIRVATVDVAAADKEKANFAVSNAVYKFDKAAGASTAIADGGIVYADIASQTGTNDADSGSNKKAGKAVRAATDADTVVYVELGAA